MSFVEATKAEILRREATDKFRPVLELLVKEAIGHRSALSGQFIVDYLRHQGIFVTKNDIQNHLIHDSRSAEANYFIGSCREGFFVIDTATDVKVMHDFYENRIAAEQRHLNSLLNQAKRVGLEIEPEPVATAA